MSGLVEPRLLGSFVLRKRHPWGAVLRQKMASLGSCSQVENGILGELFSGRKWHPWGSQVENGHPMETNRCYNAMLFGRIWMSWLAENGPLSCKLACGFCCCCCWFFTVTFIWVHVFRSSLHFRELWPNAEVMDVWGTDQNSVRKRVPQTQLEYRWGMTLIKIQSEEEET